MNSNLVADIQVFEPADHSPFDRDRQERPGTLVGRAGDQSVELLADSRLEEHRCSRLTHLTFDLIGRIFLFGDVLANTTRAS